MDKGFHTVVIGAPLDGNETRTKLSHTLMVCTVYDHGWAVQLIKEGTGIDDGHMMLVLFLIFMQGAGGKILDESPAHGYIDDLQTLADTQKGSAGADTMLYGLQLDNIQFCINTSGAFVMFTVKCRCNITSARQNDTIAGIQLSQGKGGQIICRY